MTSATWRPQGETNADVMIIDPDPVLSAVLTAAFADRALQVESSNDGREALELLTGDGERRLPGSR